MTPCPQKDIRLSQDVLKRDLGHTWLRSHPHPHPSLFVRLGALAVPAAARVQPAVPCGWGVGKMPSRLPGLLPPPCPSLSLPGGWGLSSWDP